MSKKIKLGASIETKLTAAQLISNAGFAFGKNEAGDLALTVKFPGVDTVDVTREGLEAIIERLDRPQINGSTPAAVFCRSAQDTPDGGLTVRLSDAKRSRTVSFDQQDRSDVAILLETHLGNFDKYAAQYAAAEAEAAAAQTADPETNNSADASE